MKLKPCPFCGDEPYYPGCFRFSDGQGRGAVFCSLCDARGGEVHTGYGPVEEWAHNAAAEWNARYNEQELTPSSFGAMLAVKQAAIDLCTDAIGPDSERPPGFNSAISALLKCIRGINIDHAWYRSLAKEETE